MKLELFVRDRRVRKKGIEPLVADTAQVDTFTIDFDAEWTGMVKVVVFQNGDSTAQLLYTGETQIPANVLAPGELYVACHGYKKLEDSMAVLRTVAMVRPIPVLLSEPGVTTDPTVYTPTMLEQMLTAVQAAQEAASTVRQLCAQLQADLGAGRFNGPQGIPGKNATLEIDGAEEGEQPAVYNLGTAQNARLRFVLPRGVGIRALEDNWDGTWRLTYSDGTEQILRAPGVTDLPSEAVLAEAVAAYLTEHPPAQGEPGEAGRSVTAITFLPETNQWRYTFSDGTQSDVPGPTLPTALSQLSEDSSHRTVTDTEKSGWNTAKTQAAAAMPKAGGAFTGTVSAAAAAQTPGTALLRNSRLSASEVTPGSNGEICWQYE